MGAAEIHEGAVPSTVPRGPLTLLRRLFREPLMLPAHERRRARLLSWLLLALLPACGAALAVAWSDPSSPPQLRQRYAVVIGGEIVLLALALLLNRRGRYADASRITVVAAIVGPWSSMALDSKVLGGDLIPLIYTVLPVILSSMLLSARTTVLIAIAELAALLSLVVSIPAMAAANWPSLLLFALFISAVSVVANVVNRQDMEQIEEQRRLLLKSAEELRSMSVRDPLTGLFNRRYLEETLERELHRSAREGQSFGLVMLDVDDLKAMNDRRGHAAGDQLLRQVGELLSGQVRRGDAACRYGGDEFVLILPGATADGSSKLAEKIRAGAGLLRLDDATGPRPTPSLSIGVAVFPDHGRTSEELLAAADAALYRAKREGRGRLQVAD